MHIQVLTSCTNRKAVQCQEPLRRADFKRGEEHLRQREAELEAYQRPAGEMYSGRQHLQLMRGVQTLRAEKDDVNVDVFVVSAGYGVVVEDRKIVPYDLSFSSMGKIESREWGRQLGIPGDVQRVLETPSSLTLILLGEAYITAAGLETLDVDPGGPVVLFGNKAVARRMPDRPKWRTVRVTQETASRFSQGLIWLKGYLARKIMLEVAGDLAFVDALLDASNDVLDLLDDAQLSMDLSA